MHVGLEMPGFMPDWHLVIGCKGSQHSLLCAHQSTKTPLVIRQHSPGVTVTRGRAGPRSIPSLLHVTPAVGRGHGDDDTLFLTELYSYTEGPEFLMNRKCFEEDFRMHGEMIPPTSWLFQLAS